jgi:hypothetical protein
MWFHPWNLNVDTNAMFAGLEDVFSYACRMREKGDLDILTMGEYAERLDRERNSLSFPPRSNANGGKPLRKGDSSVGEPSVSSLR